MKRIFFPFIAACLLLQFAAAQKTYVTRNGRISFLSTDDEDIKAVNNEVTSRLTADGQLSFSLLVKGFRFESQEMQDHFNDTYLESNKYPRADFSGSVTDIKNVNLSKNGSYPVLVTGKLTMHGITQPVTAKGTLLVKDGKVRAEGKFPLTLEQYKIMGGLLKAITKGVNITVDCSYQ